MKLIKRLALATALVGSIATGLVAQEKQPRGNPTGIVIVDVDFQGGHFAAFVDTVRKAAKDQSTLPLNVLVPYEASKVQLPAMTLRRVSVQTALEAAADMATPVKAINVSTRRRTGAPIFTVRVRLPRSSGARVASQAPMRVKVYSLRGVTSEPAKPGRMDAKTALTAIETGLSLVTGPGAEMKYHTDSGLLFVRGTQNQLNLIEEMISRLEYDISRQKKLEEKAARARQRERQIEAMKKQHKAQKKAAPRDH